MRSSASAVMLLPHPLSPMMPRVSPRATAKLMSDRIRTCRLRTAKSTHRPSTSRTVSFAVIAGAVAVLNARAASG